jgi:thiamine-phosphate pyrophosphorylase
VTDPRQRLSNARLYLICGAMKDDFLHAALRGGVDIVQLRMKDATEQEILAAAARFARVCREHGALFILNDRPELVAAVGADGVHVGQDDMSVDKARALAGPERLLGLSTHSPEQIDGADGADYIGVGPVYETPTKPGRPAVGLELVKYAAAHALVPYFAIGGIDLATVATVASAGAQRIAVVRALTGAEDPEPTARRLRAAISAEVRVGAT